MKKWVDFLCFFVPRKKWRKSIRKLLIRERLLSLGFQIVEIDGVRVAQKNSLYFGDVFGTDALPILEEIFVHEDYNFNVGADAVVIDIGMNIGFASLYFAAREDVKAVYGFEPFKPTFERAVLNFKINEKTARKIHPCSYGLGDSDKTLTIDYYAEKPGGMSTVRSIHEIRRHSRHNTRPETVQIKNAATEIKTIIERHRDQKIVLKCDTEGAEKEIFENLDAAGILKEIDVILLEYHFSYDIPLEGILKRNGFVYFKQKKCTTKTGDLGVMQAVKSNLQKNVC